MSWIFLVVGVFAVSLVVGLFVGRCISLGKPPDD